MAIEPHISPTHVAAAWGLDDIDEAEIDADDIPTISITGSPPAGRLRTAAE
jgi:hypothetical protein